ncbi:MAG: hypothetical protein K2N35_07270 [Muribaculaceae bacterium]|nr:hypothetical protein [Muribaculaceae bacterium]
MKKGESDILFVSRYAFSSDLMEWLNMVPNRYIHLFYDLTTTYPDINHLISLIHKYRRTYDQEGYIINNM